MAEAAPIHKTTDANTIDLTTLSLEELKTLSDQAQKQIKALEEQQRREAFRKIEDLAAELGISKADLAARFGPKKAPSPPRYRNPDNPAQTWTGRGRKPAWVQQQLDKGVTLEELAL